MVVTRAPVTPLLRRYLSTPGARHLPMYTGPSPPRLPEKEQREFEELQRKSTGAFSTPRLSQSPVAKPQANQSPQGQGESLSSELNSRIQAMDKGDELHPDVRRGAPPEFEGDRNPKTGEIGGPKNDPLRWKGDWSYNGRVTDF